MEANWYSRLTTVLRGHDMVLEVYAKGEGITGQAYPGVLVQARKEEGESRVLVMSKRDSLPGTNDWTLLRLRCYVPSESTDVWPECGMHGTGKVWFDDFSVKAEEREEEYPPPETNLLENSSFEEGIRGWHLFLEGTSVPPLYSTVRGVRDGGTALRLGTGRAPLPPPTSASIRACAGSAARRGPSP